METGSPTTQQALRTIGAQDDDGIDLGNAGLWLAKWMEPEVKRAPYLRHLDTLAENARAYVADDTDDDDIALEAARQIISRRYGYGGATDPAEQADAANLARTIDHRRGGAVTLCILYAHVLEQLGKRVEILDFPVRPLVGVTVQTGRAVIDPFDGGRLLTAQDLRRMLKDHQGKQGELTLGHLSALSPRQVLLRLQHDIKVFHLRHAAPEAALHTLEGALLIAPKEAALWRELGLVHIRLDHVGDAAEALERFLSLPGGDAHRYTASQMLQQLRRRLERGET